MLQLAGPVTLSRSGIRFPPGLSQHAWEEIGVQLHEISSSSAWWLADWLIFGESAYNGRYREAIKRTGLDYQTLRNYAWIARKFPHERRHESLSIAHHAEVARLGEPEQDYWLRKAADEQWSRNRLRRELRVSLAEREDGHPADDEGAENAAQAGSNQVELPPEQIEYCVRAADSCGLPLDEWVTHVLRSVAARFPGIELSAAGGSTRTEQTHSRVSAA